MTLLKINRLLPIYISIVPLKFEVDIQSQRKVRVWKPKKKNMAARRPFWKWRCWKSIGFCLWPSSTCIWNLKLKFQSKLYLCSGNHVVYRQTDGRTDGRTRWIQYTPPPTSLGGVNISKYYLLPIKMLWKLVFPTQYTMYHKLSQVGCDIDHTLTLFQRKKYHLLSEEKKNLWFRIFFQ